MTEVIAELIRPWMPVAAAIAAGAIAYFVVRHFA